MAGIGFAYGWAAGRCFRSSWDRWGRLSRSSGRRKAAASYASMATSIGYVNGFSIAMKSLLVTHKGGFHGIPHAFAGLIRQPAPSVVLVRALSPRLPGRYRPHDPVSRRRTP